MTGITSITVVPCGDVMVCGFVIGNIYRQNILDILTGYDPYAHPLMAAVLHGGVSELLTLALSRGVYTDPAEYYSACDICHAAVRELALRE